MRFKSAVAALAALTFAAPALAQTVTAPPPGQTQFLGTQLSTCTRNALVGAGIGAVAGLITAPKGNKTENAAIGGAVGGVGTYFVCKYLGNRDQARIERSYATALRTGKPVTSNFTPQGGGGPATLTVPAPQVDPMDANCRVLAPQLSAGGLVAQALPKERYCKGANGAWTPAPL